MRVLTRQNIELLHRTRSIREPMATLDAILLWSGVAYFLCMAAAHVTDFKVPVLFVYFDVPSTFYQNKIISFTCLTYVTLFVFAAIQGTTIPAAVSMLTTALGLAYVNLSEALHSEIRKRDSELKAGLVWYRRDTLAYWTQTVMIAGYAIVLAALAL